MTVAPRRLRANCGWLIRACRQSLVNLRGSRPRLCSGSLTSCHSTVAVTTPAATECDSGFVEAELPASVCSHWEAHLCQFCGEAVSGCLNHPTLIDVCMHMYVRVCVCGSVSGSGKRARERERENCPKTFSIQWHVKAVIEVASKEVKRRWFASPQAMYCGRGHSTCMAGLGAHSRIGSTLIPRGEKGRP